MLNGNSWVRRKMDIEQDNYIKTTSIWTGAFLSIFIANAMMNLGQQLVNTLVPKYADYLGAPATIVGMLTGVFAFTALGFKVFSGPAIDSFNRRNLLMGAMSVMAISYFGFSISNNIPMLFAFRLLEGAARAFSATCCLAIAADSLPSDRFGSGIGLFSMAQAACQAIGPTIGLTIYRYIGYSATFSIGAFLMVAGVFLASKVKTKVRKHSKFNIKLSSIFAWEAILPAILLFFISGTFFVINSFLAIYGIDMGVENIGFFFTVYAGMMLVSRPLIGKLSDLYGLVPVVIPSIISCGIAFGLISISNNLILFLFAAFIAAFGFGAAQPAIQTLCMKSVPVDRRGAASSTAYIGNDLGNLIWPVFAGIIVEQAGYQIMWQIMVLPIAVALLIVILHRRKIMQMEGDFQVN